MAATVQPVVGSNLKYHAFEKQAQKLAGVDVDKQEAIGQRFIRPFMPQQHIEFYEGLQLLFCGMRGPDGDLVATVLTGPPGFITATSPTDLIIRPHQRLSLVPGQGVGALGMEMRTRRRNRVNGVVAAAGPDFVHIRVEESFGNCPKYIQARDVMVDPSPDLAPPPEEHGTGPLSERAALLVATADTFWVATSHKAGAGDRSTCHKCDVSHRGGPRGFVRLAGPAALQWPDYVGNQFFNTLGNIMGNGQAGLLFIDFATGDALQLSGCASIEWEDHSLPGAERVITFRVERWIYMERGLPLRSTGLVQPSPYNPRLAADAASRAFVVCTNIVREADGVKSFHFAQPSYPGSGAPPPPVAYTPGQFASFDIPDPRGTGGTLNRTWTISSHPAVATPGSAFSISVKRAGLVSSWLHDAFAPGSALEFGGVGGEFCLDDGTNPVLLVAGGIGITPMRTMAHELSVRGRRGLLIYSTRRIEEAAFLKELAELAAASNGKFKLAVTVTAGASDWPGAFEGRVSAAMIAELVPDVAAHSVYMCGPDTFMRAVAALLEGLGVPARNVHEEAFSF